MTTIHSPSSEIIDITKLTPMNKSKDEWRYFCPICPEKRGKPDKEGKLYWNVIKSVGYCFKCATSFFPEGSEDEKYDRDEVEWKRSVETLLRSFPGSLYDDMKFPTEVHFDFPELTRDLLIYLRNRNPFLIPLKDCLGLKSWKGKSTGIVTPFLYNNKICRFQCRFVTIDGHPLDKKDRKYYTSPGEAKPLYSPFHIFDEFANVADLDTITLCEGTYDAIALAIMRFPSPLALCGDRMTPFQIYSIRHLTPVITKVYIALDDVERSKMIKKAIEKFLPCVEETEILSFWLPNFKDPEEYLRGNLNNSNLMNECLDMVSAWVGSGKSEDYGE